MLDVGWRKRARRPCISEALELYRQQKYEDAIAAFTQAVKTENPQSAEFKESALLIGQSYFMLSQAPKAIPWLEKVTSVNEANYMLGYAYLQTRQENESRAAFARLFDLDPNSAASAFNGRRDDAQKTI